MVITNLQEKENRKLWVPIRGGNRGGWSLFTWQQVRDMPYKDREMYLGNSATLGFLDKGGKWRKRDWYLKTDKRYNSNDLICQQNQAIKRDYQRMNAALGMQDRDDQEKLTQSQMRQLMKKIKMKKQGYQQPKLPQAMGLGFDKAKVQIRSKPSAKMQNPHRLQAFDELKDYEDDEKVQKQEKKQKKQKKKKHKQHKHHRQRHSSDQQQKHHKKKKKKDKHHKREKQHTSKQRRRERSRSHQKRRKRYSSSESRKSDSD